MSGDPIDLDAIEARASAGLAGHPSISTRGMKCASCGHALSWHNSLGLCRRGWHQQGVGGDCFGSCGWHVSDGMESLKARKMWDEEHGAGKVRRRMEALGQSTDGVFW